MSLKAEIETFLASVPMPPNAPIAVALSGGADSLCLTLLIQAWACVHGHQLIALTVDHGIRPESRREALFVGEIMAAQGIEHVILTVTEPLVGAHLEERARRARYDLMTRYCRERGIKILCVAHHLEDQAETVLAHLARGSGTDGMSGMSRVTHRDGVLLLRPLLMVPKERILTYLRQKKVSWVEDPMNKDLTYERVRWRQRLPLFAENGLSAHALAVSAERLNRARRALDFFTMRFIRCAAVFHEMGFCFIPLSAWNGQPEEIRLRALRFLISVVTPKGGAYSLRHLEQNLVRTKDFSAGGCRIVKTQNGIFITPERRTWPAPVVLKAGEVNRWYGFKVFSTCEVQMCFAPPKVRLPDIPAVVQRSFLSFGETRERSKEMLVAIVSRRYDQAVRMEGLHLFNTKSRKKTSVVFIPIKLIEKKEENDFDSEKAILKKVLAKTPNLDYNDQNTDIIYIQSDLMRTDLCD